MSSRMLATSRELGEPSQRVSRRAHTQEWNGGVATNDPVVRARQLLKDTVLGLGDRLA